MPFCNAAFRNGPAAVRRRWRPNHILFHNATIYFSIISGIIYSHVFRGRNHIRFLKTRLVNVGSAYLVMTLILTIIAFALAYHRQGPPLDWPAFARTLGFNLLTGDAWNTMWYIPVILGLYAISPWLSRLATTPRLRPLAIGLILLPLLVSRTGTVLTPAIFIYFLGAYMVGLMLGDRLEQSIAFLKQHLAIIIAVAAGSTVALVILHAAGIDMVGPTSVQESFYYLQRLSIAGLLLLGLSLLVGRGPPLWRMVIGVSASASFGIYFIHGPLLRPIARLVGSFAPADQPWWFLIGGIVITFLLGLAGSLAIVAIVRRVAGQRSRLLIGC